MQLERGTSSALLFLLSFPVVDFLPNQMQTTVWCFRFCSFGCTKHVAWVKLAISSVFFFFFLIFQKQIPFQFLSVFCLSPATACISVYFYGRKKLCSHSDVTKSGILRKSLNIFFLIVFFFLSVLLINVLQWVLFFSAPPNDLSQWFISELVSFVLQSLALPHSLHFL